jgi:four helix bundle protein
MFRFEELEIWKLSQDYAGDCYGLVNNFPKEEKYALADQLRRAAVSISNNIAEGSAFSDTKFKSYLDISIGSTLETVNIISFAIKIGYLAESDKDELYEKAEKLIRKIRSFKNYLN